MALYILYSITLVVFFTWFRQGLRWFRASKGLNRHTTLGSGAGTSQVVQSLNRVSDLVASRKYARINFFAMLLLVLPLTLGSLSAGLTDQVRRQGDEAHILGYRFNDVHTMTFMNHRGQDIREIPRADFRFIYLKGRRYTPPLWMQRLLGMDTFVIVDRVDLASDGLSVIPGSLTNETPAEVVLREPGKLDVLFALPENVLFTSRGAHTEGPFRMDEPGGWLNLLPTGPIHTPLKADNP